MGDSENSLQNRPRPTRVVFGGTLAWAGLFVGALVATPQYQLAHTTGEAPETMSWAELVERGLFDNAHVRLTDVRLTDGRGADEDLEFGQFVGSFAGNICSTGAAEGGPCRVRRRAGNRSRRAVSRVGRRGPGRSRSFRDFDGSVSAGGTRTQSRARVANGIRRDFGLADTRRPLRLCSGRNRLRPCHRARLVCRQHFGGCDRVGDGGKRPTRSLDVVGDDGPLVAELARPAPSPEPKSVDVANDLHRRRVGPDLLRVPTTHRGRTMVACRRRRPSDDARISDVGARARFDFGGRGERMVGPTAFPKESTTGRNPAGTRGHMHRSSTGPDLFATLLRPEIPSRNRYRPRRGDGR